MRAVKLNLDSTYEVFELGPYPELNQQICPEEAAAPFGLSFLNGPTHLHPEHITIGLAVDSDALRKQLPINNLACSLKGIFSLQPEPVFGTAIIVGADYLGGMASVPYWAIDLVRELKRSVDIAFKYHQNVAGN